VAALLVVEAVELAEVVHNGGIEGEVCDSGKVWYGILDG
jgi:hypothetical protein